MCKKQISGGMIKEAFLSSVGGAMFDYGACLLLFFHVSIFPLFLPFNAANKKTYWQLAPQSNHLFKPYLRLQSIARHFTAQVLRIPVYYTIVFMLLSLELLPFFLYSLLSLFFLSPVNLPALINLPTECCSYLSPFIVIEHLRYNFLSCPCISECFNRFPFRQAHTHQSPHQRLV